MMPIAFAAVAASRPAFCVTRARSSSMAVSSEAGGVFRTERRGNQADHCDGSSRTRRSRDPGPMGHGGGLGPGSSRSLSLGLPKAGPEGVGRDDGEVVAMTIANAYNSP